MATVLGGSLENLCLCFGQGGSLLFLVFLHGEPSSNVEATSHYFLFLHDDSAETLKAQHSSQVHLLIVGFGQQHLALLSWRETAINGPC
jgi:hypothetical protein|mmetsp:Transcript_35210/g.59071  ORF Transcript_35210/g.59071 Transcript_35210/m.59071 type:complete len:89 (+) Transcript_35210:2265-2531(+)